ncbi:MAG: GNAT family protein [Chloroflexota bacterium]|nr:GNAT family protein [Chloroflexota bacterium]
MSSGQHGPVTLRTARLLLRPFEITDVDDVRAYAADPDVSRFRPLPDPYTRNDALEFVKRQIQTDWSTDAEFAIVFGHRVVGGLSLHVSPEHERAELGYLLGRRWWGQGLATEAARAVVDWGFQRFNLYKVYARAHVDNSRSWRVMEKLGMSREGVLRGHWKMREEHVDLVYYAVFRDEWTPPTDSCADQGAGRARDGKVEP